MTLEGAVLLLTHTEDAFTVDRVAEGLQARGARPLRVNTDLFPSEIDIALRVGMEEGWAHEMDLGGETLRARDVRAVWNRRIWPPRLDEELDERFREGCAREASTTLRAFLSGLSLSRWVDPPSLVDAAEDKPRQLREALSAGLSIPRTLVTSDPARVRAFQVSLGGPMVTKMLSPLSTGMAGRGFFVHTSLVKPEDLEDLEGLRLCPMVFQELVPKREELRVIHVGGRFFTGVIDASRSAKGQIDWRLSEAGEVSWERGALPGDVADKLRALMKRLGLVYGAIDLVVTPDGGHVFLEVNPAGEWGMIERDLDLPIGAAIADALLSEDRSSNPA